MASTMKLKFAGFLRGLLRQMDDRESTRPVASVAPQHEPEMQSAPASAAAGEHFPAPPGAPASDELMLPLAPVIALLPMDLKAKLIATPAAGQTICVSIEEVVSQLAFGAVKISFGELRRLTPGLFANAGGEHDSRTVNLPLKEILSRLNPALLARRPVQKVEVAEEIAGPFSGHGRGVTFTTQPLKPSTVTPPLTELSKSATFPPPPAARCVQPPPAPRFVAPAPDTEIFAFTPRQATPPAAPIPFTPSFTPPAKPAGNGNGNGNSNGHGNTVLPPFKFTTAPVAPVAAASSAPRPEPAQPTIQVSLDDLAEGWPEELKNEIMRANLANVSLALPMKMVEPGLKRGRVTMTWKEVRTLARPSSAASLNDGLELELPLKVLAPAFLSAQKTLLRANPKVSVSEEIPNLFFGFPQSAPAAAAPAPASVTEPDSFPPENTNVYLTEDNGEAAASDALSLKRAANPATDFLSRQTHPKEIVARAMALPGVAGAVVALADGLRVASEVPAEQNADAVAAFLPQIFERVSQSTRELRMGALNNVAFTVGNVPWKIFRVNSIYFAAFGRAGTGLPTSQLAALAAGLDRKKQQ
jgi:predicted regulator of Ras-like GTPase activity (Roadblock/LC7/MglB family)